MDSLFHSLDNIKAVGIQINLLEAINIARELFAPYHILRYLFMTGETIYVRTSDPYRLRIFLVWVITPHCMNLIISPSLLFLLLPHTLHTSLYCPSDVLIIILGDFLIPCVAAFTPLTL